MAHVAVWIVVVFDFAIHEEVGLDEFLLDEFNVLVFGAFRTEGAGILWGDGFGDDGSDGDGFERPGFIGTVPSQRG
jgi:hypothetical protein